MCVYIYMITCSSDVVTSQMMSTVYYKSSGCYLKNVKTLG